MQEESADSSLPLVVDRAGSLFDAPAGSGLIHACNSEGSWGAGIARAFKLKYPAAYKAYRNHCSKFKINKANHMIPDLRSEDGSVVSVPYPDGSALIIRPQAEDHTSPRKKGYWIICLFTSRGYGKKVDSPTMIMNKTAAALYDLKAQMNALQVELRDPASVPSLYACRFNSGLFRVPWKRTKALIQEVGISMTVVAPDEQIEKSDEELEEGWGEESKA
ncbi:ADP-ribose 1''-phosphate phosphatase [Penicillium chermesinum]|uniref:ADP-ribose 1''-phosphate phosphatase n=1 Tax=Penicillium chermesinum TaxID=63820 RepID=A0A9W9NV80_9EURO|nr:ADP-ribose 1''-phosphate phosphatase [Penicillium chermesinum]KAJ5226451.1 ADP-ribose 1''-phosphate phosphatase [Penicillium chermesinum]KAJ6160367.1 ADP-ribose 1''-phosphate phosphatase [Penicillium chermesinum]